MGEEKVVRSKFEEKYADLFECIEAVPNPEERWEAFRRYFDQKKMEYDCFICDLMKQHKPVKYRKLMQSFQLDSKGELKKQTELESDYNDEALMLALKESIEGYDPSKDFIRCIFDKNYRQEASRYAALDKLNGLTAGEPRRKKRITSDKQKTKKEVSLGRINAKAVYLSQLVSKIKREEEWMHSARSIDEIIEDVVKHSSHPYSKKDKEDAKTLLIMFNFDYLDQEIGGSQDGEMFTYGDLVSAEEKGYSEIEQEGLETFADFLVQLAVEDWDIIKSIMNKVNCDIIKGFLTKDILIELKLDTIPADFKIKPEPKCRQWCTKAEYCKKKEGCRVRYDAIRTEPPYGDQDLYRFLKPHREQLYNKLLHKDYLDAALPNSCFEEVYQNKLFPNPALVKDLQEDDAYFDFSDGTLARALHKDKTQISHTRRQYECKIIPKMWEEFSKRRNKERGNTSDYKAPN